MITHTNGSISHLDSFIGDLCKVILNDEEIKYYNIESQFEEFSTNNEEHMRKIETHIREIADRNTVMNCLNYLKSNKNCDNIKKEKLLNFISKTEKNMKFNKKEIHDLFTEFEQENNSHFGYSNMMINEEPQFMPDQMYFNNQNLFMNQNEENFGNMAMNEKIFKLEEETSNLEHHNKSNPVEELKKLFLAHKKDENFFKKKNPFNDPLHSITECDFTPDLSNKVLSSGDNNLVKKVFQKTVLNNIVKKYLEKNKLLKFRMKNKKKRLKPKTTNRNENGDIDVIVNSLFNAGNYSEEEEDNYIFLNHKRSFN